MTSASGRLSIQPDRRRAHISWLWWLMFKPQSPMPRTPPSDDDDPGSCRHW